MISFISKYVKTKGCVNGHRKVPINNNFLTFLCSFLQLYVFFFFFSLISCGASFIERKKIKINYRISFMSFSYIYPNFLLNGTHISLTLTSTAKYLLTFSFLLFPLSFFIFILFIIICLGSQYIF